MFGFKLVTTSEYARMEKQIADLIAANETLLQIALNKAVVAAPEEDKPEEMATRPARRLVKDIKGLAEKEMLERFNASRKAS